MIDLVNENELSRSLYNESGEPTLISKNRSGSHLCPFDGHSLKATASRSPEVREKT